MRIISAVFMSTMLVSAPCLAASQKPALSTFMIVDNDDAATTSSAAKEIERLKGVIAAKNAALDSAIMAAAETSRLKKENAELKRALTLEKGNRVEPRAPEPTVDEAETLNTFGEQLAAQAKEIALLKMEADANASTARGIGEKLGKNAAPAVQDPRSLYESYLNKSGEDIFLAGVSKARMAKLPGGEVVFRVPVEMAEKANKVLGLGVQSWLKTKESIYFVTAAGAVKRS